MNSSKYYYSSCIVYTINYSCYASVLTVPLFYAAVHRFTVVHPSSTTRHIKNWCICLAAEVFWGSFLLSFSLYFVICAVHFFSLDLSKPWQGENLNNRLVFWRVLCLSGICDRTCWFKQNETYRTPNFTSTHSNQKENSTGSDTKLVGHHILHFVEFQLPHTNYMTQ